MLESIFVSPGYWIMGISTLVVVLFTIVSVCLWIRGAEGFYSGWAPTSFISGFISVIMCGLLFAVILPPYDTSFYKTYRITGELTEIESAFDGDNGTMSQIFIAAVDGIDYYIKSDDQRFRTFDVGDEVNLICYKTFRYFQEPTFSCDVGEIVRQ